MGEDRFCVGSDCTDFLHHRHDDRAVVGFNYLTIKPS